MKNFYTFGIFFALVLAGKTPEENPQQIQLGALQKVLRTAAANSIDGRAQVSNETEQVPHKNITSKNFPGPYPTNVTKQWVIETSENKTGFKIFINNLNIDPLSDVLNIYYGNISDDNRNATPKIRFTGKLDETPFKLKIPLQSIVTIEFVAQSQDVLEFNYTGFFLDYIADGVIPILQEEPDEDTTIPDDELETAVITLVVPEDQQNNKTWDEFRTLLCNASNRYIVKEKLNLEQCQSDNVTFVDISKCFETLPDAKSCVQIIFAIPLYSTAEKNVKQKVQFILQKINFEEKRILGGFDSSQLEEMWKKYGSKEFLNAGYLEYEYPNFTMIILLWLGVTFLMIVIVLIILLTACRLNIFREYFKWRSDTNDDEKMLDNEQEQDHTKIPSPHQVFPEFMPTNPPVTGYPWDNIYESRPQIPPNNPTPVENENVMPLRRESLGFQNSALQMDDEAEIGFVVDRRNTFVEGTVKGHSVT